MAHELSSTTLKILDILNDCKTHTGTEIAEQLHISRNAVWKVIQQLKKHNVIIHSHHEGYLLKTPLIPLNKDKIKNLIEEPGINIACFETLTSTNDTLKDSISLNYPQICLTEYQSKGRGRMGRSWTSPFGRNIYYSFTYGFEKDVSELSGLSLVIGILTAQALEVFDQKLKPMIKWPNDIYIDNQKLGGILIDINAEAHGKCMTIIGVGLNVNMKDVELKNVDQRWTSLEHILNNQLDRNIILAHLINSLFKGMKIFAEQGIKPFLDEWKRYDLLTHKPISVIQGSTHISGIARGITSQGHLLLEFSSGAIRQFSYGDTSIHTH